MTRCLGVSLLAVAAPMARGEAQVDPDRVERAAALLGELVETPGVSGDEERVRELILRRLPGWARSRAEVDAAGNVWVRFGAGEPLSVFVAHMDETGFEVTSVAPDGILELRGRGGFLPGLWEATPAVVHTEAGPVNGVFTPRAELGDEPTRAPPSPGRGMMGFGVDVGAQSAAEVAGMGIAVGDMVTNPKRFVRLAGTRATGRSFDDRVGSAAQILALHEIDPDNATHAFAFLWVVEEEIGLVGSAAAAESLGFTAHRVYPIDTFVAADGPHDRRNFAATPIGAGPVARAVDNSSVTPPAVLDTLRRVAAERGVPLQVGTTNGGNDGSAFQGFGVVDIPIGWPLRYSHSPVEVIDLRDVVNLVDVIRAIVESW